MIRNVVILFFIIYPLFVLFSRQPDYFDGEFNRAVIHHVLDSAAGNTKAIAAYNIRRQPYTIDATYPFNHYTEGERVKIIYETSNPQRASVYSVWGYWIRWKELLSMVALFVALYFLAVSITNSPSPESLMEQLGNGEPERRKRRYED